MGTHDQIQSLRRSTYSVRPYQGALDTATFTLLHRQIITSSLLVIFIPLEASLILSKAHAAVQSGVRTLFPRGNHASSKDIHRILRMDDLERVRGQSVVIRFSIVSAGVLFLYSNGLSQIECQYDIYFGLEIFPIATI